MSCKCDFVIARSGVAELFILINNRWKDLIDLSFKCPKCNKKIEYSNNKNYPNMWDVKL